jgi:hypothetical protein
VGVGDVQANFTSKGEVRVDTSQIKLNPLRGWQATNTILHGKGHVRDGTSF